MAKKCPKCNADNPNTSRFFTDCGTKIISIEDISVTKTIQETIASLGKTVAGKYKILSAHTMGIHRRIYMLIRME